MNIGESQQDDLRLQRRDVYCALAMSALTLVLRLMYLSHSPDGSWPHSMNYEGDAPVWAAWAQHLQQGKPFEYDLALRTPGVAWLLNWLGLHAPPFTGAKIIWCAMSASTTGLLYLVVARWFSRRAGFIASTLFALSYGSFVLSTSLNNEAPYALLLVAILGATLRWIDGPTFGWSLWLGVLHACAMLLRAEHALLLAMLIIYATTRASSHRAGSFRGALTHSALALSVSLALCAPWIIRSRNAARAFNTIGPTIAYTTAQPPWTPAAIAYFNQLPAYARAGNFAYLCALNKRSGLLVVDEDDVRAFFDQQWGYTPEPIQEWSLISLKGPLDFALANHPRADGGFSMAGLVDSHDSDAIFSMARPSHARLVNHGYDIGLKAIQSNPAQWFALALEKWARFQDGATLGLFANDWPHQQPHIRRAVDVATPNRSDAPIWNTSVLASLALGAFFACLRRGGMILLLIVGYKIAITIAFYGYARQAVSIAPVLFSLSALGLDALCMLAPRVHFLRWPIRVGLAVVFGIAAVAAVHPPRFTVRPASVQGRIANTPIWGPGAFESVDALLLEPRSG